VLHRRPVADRHAGRRDRPPRQRRQAERRSVQPARDRLRHRADHPVLADRGAGRVRLPVPADLRQHGKPEHDQPAGAGGPPAGAFADGGWYRTGDIGRLTADGYLYILDRARDMIISGGENIYPAEVEAVLVRHPAVADAAVLGRPDPTWGEAVHAVVIPVSG